MPVDSTKGRTVKSDETLIAIIESIKERKGAGVTEIASDLGLAKSTVHGHLSTLEHHGFLVKKGDEYQIGLRFLDYGIHARDNKDIYTVALAKVQELAEESKERAWCEVEENGLGVFICEAVGERTVNTDARIGKRMPLHCHAGGKAIMAFLPPARIEATIDRYGLQGRTENTITDRDALAAELETVRERGYAVNREESILGIHAVAAPVRDSRGEVLGAVSVTGAANRMPESRITGRISEMVLAAANEIELNFTYT